MMKYGKLIFLLIYFPYKEGTEFVPHQEIHKNDIF
jgi:hypothetical protein